MRAYAVIACSAAVALAAGALTEAVLPPGLWARLAAVALALACMVPAIREAHSGD